VTSGPAIRRAGPGDIPGMRAILASHDEDGPPLPGHPDVIGPYLRHLIEHHRVLVIDPTGEEAEAGVVAFGAVVDTGRVRMLTDLFVQADRLGQGLGRPLLAELFEDAPRRATFSSADPRALPSYVRAGMAPRWVGLYLSGDPARLPAPHPALAARDAAPGECAALELAWTGADRPADHVFFASQGGADAFVIEADGEPVAFAYARARQASEARCVDRLLVRPGLDPVSPILVAMGRAARGGRLDMTVPGPNPILPVLLDHGFRITDRDQYLASHDDIVDPVRMLPNPGLL
jgi:GNAT superfamily N-acetyltransferase